MKNLIATAVLIGAAAVFAADPNPFADYTAGTASDKKSPSAAVWHDANRATIESETSECKLAAFVENAESAKALLAKVQPAYGTDPIVAVQIAAVSQYVMVNEPSWWEFWNWFSDSPRCVWTSALLEAAASAPDTYRAEYYLDQLRWCGYPEQAAKVLEIGKAAKCKALKDFAKIVARELDPSIRCGKYCCKKETGCCKKAESCGAKKGKCSGK